MEYADVHVGFPVKGPFTYKTSESARPLPGMRVKVDFAGRNTTAFVIRVHNDPPEGVELKELISVIDEQPVFDERLVELATYVSNYYMCSAGEALATALPAGERQSSRLKNPFGAFSKREVVLSQEQDAVYRSISDAARHEQLQHLIFGVTGSGKTEIYMELARDAVRANRSVIYLVPEISLSSQIFKRLYDVFGDDLIAYHSQLTRNQRLYNWARFFRGDAKVAIGTRSAVFLQPPDLGLIIVDEEHDGSYKEHSAPRYNARRIAWHRSTTEKALLVMGSATPSVDTLYTAEMGAFRLHTLKDRYGNIRMPSIDVVKINAGTARSVLSARLMLHTKKALEKGQQVIFLLNRRGFAPVLLCDQCGKTEECPHCNISMNYHRGDLMLCHYCGHRNRVPLTCSACGSDRMVKLGSGTQRAEDVIAGIYKDSTVFRLDQDTSHLRGTGHTLVENMKNGDIDILLGTQMVAKGFDFPNVSLVGIILADIGLNMPDFRSTERIFSLLMQAAGRCGRGESEGMVIIQTFDDDHYIYEYLKRHDYMGFYRHELSARKQMGYPPFSRLVRLLVRGRAEERVRETIEKISTLINEIVWDENLPVTLLGPAQAPFAKIAGNYRHHVVLKAGSIELLRRVVAHARENTVLRDVHLEIDVDPSDMM